jgi:hypothetical protein
MGTFRVISVPHEGETWRWIDHSSYYWDELWLLLCNDYPNSDAFLAIQLETGEITTVFPAHAPNDWNLIL